MQSCEEILVSIATFYSFAKYMVNEMDNNVLTVMNALLKVVKLLNSLEGRKFGKGF
jgi:hypothetical protein